MWCLPCCFKPSTSEDQFEAETRQAIQASRFEADTQEAKMLSLVIHEDEQLSLALKESSRQQEEDEERRRNRELEKDEQIAKGLQYEERERVINNETALGDQEEDEQLHKTLLESLKENNKRKQCEEQVEKDEQIAKALQYEEREKEINNETALGDQEEDELLHKTLLESLKEDNKRKQCEEQVEKDEQLALVVQERLNIEKYPTQIEENKRISPIAPSDVAKQLTKAGLKDKGKRKQFEDDQVENDKQHALMFQERLNMVKSPPRHDNDQRVNWESLKGTGQRKQSKDEVEEDGELPEVNPPSSMYGGSNSVIEDGRSVNVSGWHPECLICDACDKQIDKDHVSNSRGSFHRSCYDRYCYICKGKFKEFAKHPFWKELYCHAHETDGTPKCCSCERLEPKGMDYVMLDDGRRLCLECMDSAVMDSHECQPLHFEMREFFEGLNMKIDKEFPFLLVEQQALNKAEKEEKIDYEFEGLTRGICLSEEQNVDSVTQRPTMGPDNKLRRVETEAQRVVRKCKCEVTAILIVYGLPRLLTGYILAHEMMHAYFRLNGHRNLNKLLEEGICQVLAHMWLESQTYTAIDATAAAASSSASSSSGSASKKGKCSDFEKELVGFFKNQIETDDTPLYGEGFRKVNEMKTHFNSLEATIKEILRRSGR